MSDVVYTSEQRSEGHAFVPQISSFHSQYNLLHKLRPTVFKRQNKKICKARQFPACALFSFHLSDDLPGQNVTFQCFKK